MAIFAVAIFVFFAAWAGILFYQFRLAVREADGAFSRAQADGRFSSDETLAQYETAWLRTSPVRVGLFRWVASALAVLSVPLTVFIVSLIWKLLYYSLGRPVALTEGELVHSFGLAVISIAVLVLIAGVAARRYHMFRPTDFDSEWIRQKTVPQNGFMPAGPANPGVKLKKKAKK